MGVLGMFARGGASQRGRQARACGRREGTGSGRKPATTERGQRSARRRETATERREMTAGGRKPTAEGGQIAANGWKPAARIREVGRDAGEIAPRRRQIELQRGSPLATGDRRLGSPRPWETSTARARQVDAHAAR